jgi:hypothetical protein
MTISQIVIISYPLSRVIPKYSFLGLFRFGPEIKVDIKLCCGADGVVYYKVINGPPNIDYERALGEAFEQAKIEVIRMWNNRRRTSRVIIKPRINIGSGPENPKHSFVAGETTRRRRAVSGAVLEEIKKEALVPKIEEIPPPPKPYEKQKTIEYRETDVAFGETSKIYGRQTHSIRKSDHPL